MCVKRSGDCGARFANSKPTCCVREQPQPVHRLSMVILIWSQCTSSTGTPGLNCVFWKRWLPNMMAVQLYEQILKSFFLFRAAFNTITLYRLRFVLSPLFFLSLFVTVITSACYHADRYAYHLCAMLFLPPFSLAVDNLPIEESFLSSFVSISTPYLAGAFLFLMPSAG